jgi:EpsI family protein
VSVNDTAAQPPELDGWSGPKAYAPDWRPIFVGADEEFLAAYQRESAGVVALYRARYHSQRQGKELLGLGNSVVGARHRSTSSNRRYVDVGFGTVSISEQVALGPDGQEMVIWSFFTVDGIPDPLGLPSRLLYGIRSLTRAPTAGVIALAAGCRPDCEHARSSIQALSAEALPALLAPARRNEASLATYAN